MIRICTRCGKKYTCTSGSEADKDGLCGICFRIENAPTIQTTTKIKSLFDEDKEVSSNTMTLSQSASNQPKVSSQSRLIVLPISTSIPKYEERPLTYYWDLLVKFDFSDCLTFEAVKQKFPDKDPAFLRKLIYLKGLKMDKDYWLEESEEKAPMPLSTQPASQKKEEPAGAYANQALTDAYRLHPDLSELPRMRVEEPQRIERPEREEIEEQETLEWPDTDEYEESKPSITDRTYPRRRYNWWEPDDRAVFSLYEMEQESEGYCEECTNYAPLRYVNGLFLCEICRNSLRAGSIF